MATGSTLLVFLVVPALLFSVILIPTSTAFQATAFHPLSQSFVGNTQNQRRKCRRSLHRLQDAPSPQQEKQEQLERLGFSKEEIERSAQKGDDAPVKVQVNELPNIDAVTLTAIGFGLIAANFFIFANMGDGGIAGIVATVINTLKE